MAYKIGKETGTIVEDYPENDQRPYMINKYGGRLVASGLSDKDAQYIVDCVNQVNALTKNTSAKRIPHHYGIVFNNGKPRQEHFFMPDKLQSMLANRDQDEPITPYYADLPHFEDGDLSVNEQNVRFLEVRKTGFGIGIDHIEAIHLPTGIRFVGEPDRSIHRMRQSALEGLKKVLDDVKELGEVC